MTDFLFSFAGKEYLQTQYVEKERSTYELARERGVYANLINRALKHHNLPVRDKSEAQRAALKSGRHKHPTRKETNGPQEACGCA